MNKRELKKAEQCQVNEYVCVSEGERDREREEELNCVRLKKTRD